MLSILPRSLFMIGTFAVLQASALGDPVAAAIGSQAHLSTLFHNVSGTVTILDVDTVRVDGFTYNGGGPAVYFYLGTSEDDLAFEHGLRIGSLLSHTSFDGTQGPLVVDLPVGETLEGYHAFSVWCELASANFGSGTFQPVAVPEPAALSLIAFGGLHLLLRRRRL